MGWTVLLGFGCFLVAQLGCKRGFYYRTADRDAYEVLSEKGQGPSWNLQPGFTVQPDSRSRFFDPTCPTDPRLPMPAPQLYNYELPPLVSEPPKARDLSAAVPADEKRSSQELEIAPLRSDAPNDARNAPTTPGQSTGKPSTQSPSELVPPPQSSTQPQPLTLSSHRSASRGPDVPVVPASARTSVVEPAQPLDMRQQTPTQDKDAEDVEAEELPAPQEAQQLSEVFELRINPVPKDAWYSLPDSCVRRMLEFATVREEYERTFGEEVTEERLDSAERLTLENILEIALINSRAYQTRKETLYRTALRLSFQRFDYDLKFFSRGNGTDLNYTHTRVGGVEVNRLGIPTNLGITRSLYTAGDLAARFANDVVLTFNGASGYSSQVGSELLFEFAQPLLQRDIQFEPLTQAERDVVYAARDFVRFRKQLFRDLANQYYGLLLTYRGIAINTQDYFSNLRGFNRTAALEQVGNVPRFQVDQFEQNALRSRGNVINSCNSLEGALDRLKLRIGLPTELPINVDLSELEELTLRDEATVIQEQIQRKLQYVQQVDREGAETAVTAAAELARRMLNLALVKQRLGTDDEGLVNEIQLLVAQLEVEGLRVDARRAQVLLDNLEDDIPARTFGRTTDAISLPLKALQREMELLAQAYQIKELSEQLSTPDTPGTASDSDADTEQDSWDTPRASRLSPREAIKKLPPELKQLNTELRDLISRFLAIQRELQAITSSQGKQEFYRTGSAELIDLSPAITDLDERVSQALGELGIKLAASAVEVADITERALARSQATDILDPDTGLVPIEVDMNEAMLTALVQRLDLMNRRGELADAWRDIKFAGDDLRSILNVRASQSIRTRLGSNNPFDFSFDDSTTRLSLDFDTPLNRRGERNSFRLALIDYNAALRNLIEAQDTVKLEIRDDLRSLELDRNQYDISIASAALAYERVVSTRLQLTLGTRNVTARDFLEAQQAYTQSLSSVAQQHIGYILDRIDFFLNLEQLEVNELNFWPELRAESYPFQPNLDFQSTTPDGYGTLPCGPWYTDCMRRMEQVPSGVSMIHQTNSPKAAQRDGELEESDFPGPAESPAIPESLELDAGAVNREP